MEGNTLNFYAMEISHLEEKLLNEVEVDDEEAGYQSPENDPRVVQMPLLRVA